MALDDSGEK
jgi:hypothetical protein